MSRFVTIEVGCGGIPDGGQVAFTGAVQVIDGGLDDVTCSELIHSVDVSVIFGEVWNMEE
jgi:hypothetical protein